MNKRRFGNLRQLPSGRWQARYTGPDLREHKGPRTWLSKDDATGWLRAEERLVEMELWRPPETREAAQQARSVTVAEYAERWTAQRRLKPTTRTQYESYRRVWLTDTQLGRSPIGVVTLADVRDWMADMQADKPRNSDGATRNARVYAWLRTVFASAVDDHLLEQNPCRIRGASSTRRQRNIVVPTPEEVDRLAAAMPDRLALLITLAAWCAMRRGELLHLRRRDVAADGSEIRVNGSVTFVKGKPTSGTPKNEKQGVVAVPPHLHAAVVEHLAKHTSQGARALLFPSTAAGSQSEFLDEWTLRFHWDAARAEVGLDHLRLHDLRHAGSMWAASAGATVPELQARLRHESTAAALRYMHAATGSDRAIADRLSALVAEPEPE